MKKLKISINSFLAKLCSGGVALLGFGCSSSNEPECMYGTPYGEFEIKGTVTTEENQAVEGATLRVTRPDMQSGMHAIETTKTDSDGKYMLEGSDFPADMKVVCIPDNPALEADSLVVDLDYKKKGDKNSWNYGRAEATVNFKLKKKDKQ